MGNTNKDGQKLPFHQLGENLKKLRESRQESLAEVSGAVEIEQDSLIAIELGQERPPQDILLLLISHFGTKDDLANKLWELAGYEQNVIPGSNVMNDENGSNQPSVMVMPADARISYTDMVHVVANNYGVVMNFMQAAGPTNQPLAVARIGMSKEHARSVIEVLQKTLAQSEPKSIPSSTHTAKSNKKTK